MPETDDGQNVPYAALIHPSNPDSGVYGGMSLAIFPAPDAPCLLTFVVGTNGLAPDENVLGRPGHARKLNALCGWLNSKQARGRLVAWAKQEPSRTDLAIPGNVGSEFSNYAPAFRKYGRVLYGIYAPTGNKEQTLEALTAFLDLMFEERDENPIKQFQIERDSIRQQWLEHLMPDISEHDAATLLDQRRYVVLQGPPGTGKTRMARELIRKQYDGRGRTIQFHANTTYENFVGGLAPDTAVDAVGLKFAPKKGFLIEAAEQASSSKKPYLLHIDEINRADLSKVLGEAIYLLEADDSSDRSLDLPFDFGPPFGQRLSLPKNLHIIGTMNTADRSLAVVDVAIRRRFAFQKLWPQMSVVRAGGSETMQHAFAELLSIFVEHATDDAFQLMPGHSYFLDKDPNNAGQRLRVTLAPLIEEYLAQGYVTSFAEPLRSYLQWINTL
ncbi:MAG TPA: AAA family ATPase [Candidatus Binataceae bacterium]|nr:AAA family ATPase [Candidatus Binataceae bacterium]